MHLYFLLRFSVVHIFRSCSIMIHVKKLIIKKLAIKLIILLNFSVTPHSDREIRKKKEKKKEKKKKTESSSDLGRCSIRK